MYLENVFIYQVHQQVLIYWTVL